MHTEANEKNILKKILRKKIEMKSAR